MTPVYSTVQKRDPVDADLVVSGQWSVVSQCAEFLRHVVGLLSLMDATPHDAASPEASEGSRAAAVIRQCIYSPASLVMLLL